MHSAARAVFAVAIVATAVSCSDQAITAARRVGLTQLAISPAFQQGASGGPLLPVAKIRGVLATMSGTDSAVTEADIAGDSAVLSFANVVVRGDSALYSLAVRAFDADGTMLFEGAQSLTVRPGMNAPAAPALAYSAPDAAVTTLVVAPTPIALDWAGANANDFTCLNRATLLAARTSQQLTVVGKDAAGVVVDGVRVGWTSRDTSVAVVDAFGVVRSRCSSKSTFIVARTFTGKADSVVVGVTAPPFALLMFPDSASVARDDSLQLAAKLVDENGNAITTTNVSWQSSDTARATVSDGGLVRAKATGRVLVSARSGDRQTIAVVRVVRPRAARVEIVPASDSVAVGQRSAFLAAAYDRSGRVIPDAAGFTWTSTNPAVAPVSGFGAVAGVTAGETGVIVALDGVADTAGVRVVTATTGGVTGRVVDAATGTPLAGASVASASNPNFPVTTDAEGRFTLVGLAPGQDLTITRSSYAAVTQYSLRIVPADVVELPDIPMAVSGGAGTVEGTVINAVNDAAVAGATVKLFANIEPPSSDANSGLTTPLPVATTITDAAGAFAFAAIASGTYTIAVGGAGFAATRVVTAAVANASRISRVALSPMFTTAGLRAVVTWGDCQTTANVSCDLDAHLSGPSVAPDTGRFHVAFFQRTYTPAGVGVAKLDNDAQSGPGPETITFRAASPGVYRFYVHDASSGYDSTSTRMATSRVRVDVYSGTALVATFYPPRGGLGTVWEVFEYDGTSIIPVGQMVRVQDFTRVGADF
jgi:hypothetical protein